MKKLNVILLIFSFVLSGLGGLFLFGATASNECIIPTNAPTVEEITEWTYKTYEDYFIDYDINKETITEADFTGNGSKNDPFVVHSTKGFLYLTNNVLSGISLNNKYIDFCADVILNDEIFDKNGNPSGGDGKVYSWKPITGAVGCSFNGNGHTIYGLYLNDLTRSGVGLFYNDLSKVENLTMKNTLIQGNKNIASVTQGYIKEVNNVHTYGYLKGESFVFGIAVNAGYASMKTTNSSNHANITQIDLGTSNLRTAFAGISRTTTLENCNNYGDITVFYTDYVGGLVSSGKCFNCNNYGKISCIAAEKNQLVGLGGICAYIESNAGLIKNCNNYGELSSVIGKGYTGAILGYLSIGSTTIENCNNYGNLRGVSGFAGGGYNGKHILRNCTNYGNITNQTLFVYNAQSDYLFDGCINYGNLYTTGSPIHGILMNHMSNQNITIKNCKLYGAIIGIHSSVYLSLFGHGFKEKVLILDNFYCDFTYDINANVRVLGYTNIGSGQVYIKNSIFNYNVKSTAPKSFLLLDSCGANLNFNMENVEFNNTYQQTMSMSFFSLYYGTGSFKNIKITETCPEKPEIRSLAWAASSSDKLIADVNSIIREIKTNNETLKMYYGTNFSGFYFSWRTGKVGLVALDGRGQFQGTIDEEWLKSKGFEKKSV